MAEWFKAAVLKTVVRKHRGFESYSLRQQTGNQHWRDDRVGRWCSPAKRVWGLYSTEGSNPSLSAIFDIGKGWLAIQPAFAVFQPLPLNLTILYHIQPWFTSAALLKM